MNNNFISTAMGKAFMLATGYGAYKIGKVFIDYTKCVVMERDAWKLVAKAQQEVIKDFYDKIEELKRSNSTEDQGE